MKDQQEEKPKSKWGAPLATFHFIHYDPNDYGQADSFLDAMKYYFPKGKPGITTCNPYKLVENGHKHCYEILDIEKPQDITIKEEFIPVFKHVSKDYEDGLNSLKRRLVSLIEELGEVAESDEAFETKMSMIRRQREAYKSEKALRGPLCNLLDKKLPKTKFIKYVKNEAHSDLYEPSDRDEVFPETKTNGPSDKTEQKGFTFGTSSTNSKKTNKTSTRGFTFGADTSQGHTFNFNFNA